MSAGASISPAERLARAVLLFHTAGPWTEHRRHTWRVLTGADDATSRALCDLARLVHAEEERGGAMSADTYLVWSHEHSAWWGPGRNGYVRRLSQAGRYSRAVALDICCTALPGSHALPELPVRLEDIELMQAGHHIRYADRVEPWE
jgi:hypothetical protein